MPLPVTHHGSGVGGRFVEPQGPRVMLPLGPVDRDSGVFHTPRGRTRDLRNLLLTDGVAKLRAGLEATTTQFIGTDGYGSTDIIGIQYLTVENTAIVVGYSRISGAVDIFKVQGDGEDPAPEFVGKWFDFVYNDELPVITMAESANKVFMAHDMTVQEERAPTFVYSPQGDLPTDLAPYTSSYGPLRATWDTDDSGAVGTEDLIYFRGVVAWLDYLVGWGWANNVTNRPELVRISLPGEPIYGPGRTDDQGVSVAGKAGFDPSHWVIAGSRGAPVISCAPAGNGMLIMKPDSTYPLLGTSPATFGVGPAVDPNFGIIGPNLWVNINGRLFVWTHEGPKMTTGGPMEDMALPLDLDGPSPDGLNHLHPGGFGAYVPKTRVVLFVFDSWVYALDIDAGPGGWSYWDLGVSLRSSDVLYLGGIAAISEPPAGPWTVDQASATDTSVTLNLDITGNEGDNIQVWYREQASSTWNRSQVDEVQAVEGNTSVAIEVTGLTYATAYEFAFRYDREGAVHSGATYDYSGTPDTWPAGSRVQGATNGLSLGVWSRTSDVREIVTLSFIEHEPTGSELYKSTDDGATWSPVASNIADGYEYEVQAGEEETWMEFKVEYPTATPVPTPQTGRVWIGPIKPTNPFQQVPGAVHWYEYSITFGMGEAGPKTRIEDNYTDTAWTFRETLNNDVTASNTIFLERTSLQADAGSYLYWTFTCRIRHEWTQFGVTDYSDWTEFEVDVELNPDETAHQTGGGHPTQV